jgi:hypothetical protein
MENNIWICKVCHKKIDYFKHLCLHKKYSVNCQCSDSGPSPFIHEQGNLIL